MDKYKTSIEILKNFVGFDPQAFSTLASETSEEVASSILHEFRHTLHQCTLVFTETLSSPSPDGELLSKTCHRLKGSAQLLGFTDLASQAETLRLSTKNQEGPEKWMSNLKQFHAECLKVQDQLEKIFQS